MRNRRRTRVLRRLVLGLAVAATIVPAAQARVDGDSNWSGVGRSTTVDTASVLVAGERHDGFVVGSPAETGLVHGERYSDHATGGEPIAVVRAQDYKRYWAPSGVQPANRYAGYVRAMPDDSGTIAGGQPIQVASEPNGFHWRDGLVALAALGLALLAAGALLGARRGRTATA